MPVSALRSVPSRQHNQTSEQVLVWPGRQGLNARLSRMFKTTDDAAQAIQKQGIKDEWIAYVLQSPAKCVTDREDPTLEHRLAVIPALDFQVLRVIFRKETISPLVTTVTFDQSMKGKL